MLCAPLSGGSGRLGGGYSLQQLLLRNGSSRKVGTTAPLTLTRCARANLHPPSPHKAPALGSPPIEAAGPDPWFTFQETPRCPVKGPLDRLPCVVPGLPPDLFVREMTRCRRLMGGFSNGGVVRIEIAQVEKDRWPLSTVCPFVGTVLENLTTLTAGGPQSAFTIRLGQTFRVCNYSSIGLRQHTVLSSYLL